MGDSNQFYTSKINHHTIRESQEKKALERKRNIFLLIHSFLKENCLENTAESLVKEANLPGNLEVCDNVDLDTILQEYTSYYFTKFGKYPKISKRVNSATEIPEKKKQPRPQPRPNSKTEEVRKPEIDFEISVKSLGNNDSNQDLIPEEVTKNLPEILSSINLADYPPEWKEMFQIIIREIIPKNLGIRWSDCIGLDHIIELLEEAIIYPIKYPEFFKYVSPWKGVLLYGPPGTGKTLVARALACETQSVVINVSPSIFISKWRGESEKLIRCLFEVAQKCSPCIIFIDEIDALASRREVQQHEASRRFKSELLTQMDGILNNNNSRIFILATTNLPWEVDSAILRRFDRKVFVDLPDKQSRLEMFRKFLNIEGVEVPTRDLEIFASDSRNFSGSDIKLVYKSAFMRVVRRCIDYLKKNSNGYGNFLTECIPTPDDVRKALIESCTPSTQGVNKYLEWQKDFVGK